MLNYQRVYIYIYPLNTIDPPCFGEKMKLPSLPRLRRLSVTRSGQLRQRFSPRPDLHQWENPWNHGFWSAKWWRNEDDHLILEVSWSRRDWARVEQISVWMQIWWCFNHPFVTVLSPRFFAWATLPLAQEEGDSSPRSRDTASAECASGWWYTYPSGKIWKSVGITIPNRWKVIKFMFQTTNQASFHPNPIDKLQPHSTVPVVRCGLP